MTEERLEELKASARSAIEQQEKALTDERAQQARIIPLLAQLSDSVTINWGDGRTWITVNNREDLKVLFTLAPQWKKEACGDSIVYTNNSYPNPYFRIAATDEALPPTCRVVVEKRIEPAREAQEYEISTIKCDL